MELPTTPRRDRPLPRPVAVFVALVLMVGVVLTVGPQPASAACDYRDADQNGGWGWDPDTATSCAPLDDRPAEAGACTDPDGDGWGWDGTRSCRMDVPETAAAVPIVAQVAGALVLLGTVTLLPPPSGPPEDPWNDNPLVPDWRDHLLNETFPGWAADQAAGYAGRFSLHPSQLANERSAQLQNDGLVLDVDGSRQNTYRRTNPDGSGVFATISFDGDTVTETVITLNGYGAATTEVTVAYDFERGFLGRRYIDSTTVTVVTYQRSPYTGEIQWLVEERFIDGVAQPVEYIHPVEVEASSPGTGPDRVDQHGIPLNDTTDPDGDGISVFGDMDNDNDGVPTHQDPDDLDPTVPGAGDGGAGDGGAEGGGDGGGGGGSTVTDGNGNEIKTGDGTALQSG